ncbi:MAG TPA: DoxX family membrane protein, partial [Vicinamibacterales bacterium]|nr:DoxX family membrane protein [Vicinamibacterales bacterium]
MAIDRQGTGLSILRVCIGIFFLFEGIGKIRWFTDTSQLASQLAAWSQAVPSGSWSAVYLERVAMPYSLYFARL